MSKRKKKRMGPITTAFCKVCRHHVVDMEKHILTEEHIRLLKRAAMDEPFVSTPRVPVGGMKGGKV